MAQETHFRRTTKWCAFVLLAALLASLALPLAAQSYPQNPPPPPQQYPPPQQQYPPQQQQYPPQDQPYPQAGPPPYTGSAPAFYPGQLDSLVSRVALYPDPLLAEVLTASTYPDQIPQAAGWANQHRYLNGDALAQAIAYDQVYWEPSVMALLPFPAVLDMMARDPGWTQQLGAAVLAQRPDVMDAVQRMRQRAMDYGYLRSSPYVRVVPAGPGLIEIQPVDPGYYYVPVYNPGVVFVRPARGVYVGAAISFGPRIFIGATLGRYGWAGPGIDWRARTVIIDRTPWQRTWANRQNYAHPYVARPERSATPPVERHERDIRNQRERPRRDRREDDRHDH